MSFPAFFAHFLEISSFFPVLVLLNKFFKKHMIDWKVQTFKSDCDVSRCACYCFLFFSILNWRKNYVTDLSRESRSCVKIMFCKRAVFAFAFSRFWHLAPFSLFSRSFRSRAAPRRVVDRERGKRSCTREETKLNAYWRSKSRRTSFKVPHSPCRREFGHFFSASKLGHNVMLVIDSCFF